VLRISHPALDVRTFALKVEGRLVGEWVGMLEAELARGEGSGRRVVLDLSAVDYASREAVALLQAAIERGVQVGDCSPLLSSQLSRPAR
jgi:hypothetical protein